MRLALASLVALTLTFGCVRFGYDTAPAPMPDAAQRDAAPAGDAAVADAGRPPDAGSVDAAVMDAAGEPTELCPERSDVLFCDGFEDPEFSRWSYPRKVNGTLDTSTAEVHSGMSSLRAATGVATGENSEARYGAKVFDHQTTGDIWVRAYYYLPSSVVVNTNFSTVVVSEVEPPYFGFSLIVRASGFDITQGTAWYRSTTVFPRDKWTCVEMHIEIDAAQGLVEGYLDGARVVSTSTSTPTDTLPDKGYTTVDVGIHYTDPQQGPVELFVDDVVAGNTRIGCN